MGMSEYQIWVLPAILGDFPPACLFCNFLSVVLMVEWRSVGKCEAINQLSWNNNKTGKYCLTSDKSMAGEIFATIFSKINPIIGEQTNQFPILIVSTQHFHFPTTNKLKCQKKYHPLGAHLTKNLRRVALFDGTLTAYNSG